MKSIEISIRDFYLSSIVDIQGTIRSIDSKLFGTIVLLLLPFTEFDSIVTIFQLLIQKFKCFGSWLTVLMIISWYCAFMFSFMGMFSISNPSKKIRNSGNLGKFFNPNQFGISIFQVIWPKSVYSKATMAQVLKKSHLTEKEILKELVFEQMKLSFVRDLKMKRQNLAIIFLFCSALIISISILVLKLV